MAQTRPKPTLGLTLTILFVATVVRADDPPILHEYVPEVDDGELPPMVSGADGPASEPSAILYEGEFLEAPEGGARRSDERAMQAAPGEGEGQEAPGRRSPTFRPDRITNLEETLGYYEVFTPGVTPFKRVTSLDAVARIDGGTPVLGVANEALRALPVEGASAPQPDDRARERFWGSVVVDFSEGPLAPFPSVSPESRILTLRTEPQTAIRIEVDGSGNFFARSLAAMRGEVRVVFLTDAPRDFFNAERIPVVASNVLEGEVFPMDDRLRSDALIFAAELGLSRGDPLPEVLDTLTAHFRAFVESEQPPSNTGNIYLDLARSQRGVCRHRAYAFLITSQALGIPTRFVHNEAHAWVEVKMVDVGWMRIDLGGAASGLDAHGADDRPLHHPTYPDPLPRPETYLRQVSQLPPDTTTGLREGEGGGATSAGGTVPGEGVGESSETGEAGEAGQTEAGVGDEPSGLSAVFSEPEDVTHARPLRLLVDRHSFEALRGRALTVSGRALNPDGDGVEGLRVELLAKRAGTERLLGVTVTRPGGIYRASIGVPPDIRVGQYELIVRTPGNEAFFPATAR